MQSMNILMVVLMIDLMNTVVCKTYRQNLAHILHGLSVTAPAATKLVGSSTHDRTENRY